MPDMHNHVDLEVLHEVERLLSGASRPVLDLADDSVDLDAPKSVARSDDHAVTPLPQRR